MASNTDSLVAGFLLLCVRDRLRDVAPVLNVWFGHGFGDIRPANGEAGNHLGERQPQALEREIARVPMLLANAVETPRKDIQLARHRSTENEPFALVHQLREIGAPTRILRQQEGLCESLPTDAAGTCLEDG